MKVSTCRQFVFRPRPARRQRGAAAILAMMFLVIFGSLAAAMAIVSQGNLRTADTHLKINRALAAAETGMHYMSYRLNRVTLPTPEDGENDRTVFTTDGEIDADDARALWLASSDGILAQLHDALASDAHYLAGSGPSVATFSIGDIDGDGTEERCGLLQSGEIQLAPNGPTFEATLIQHPIPYEAMPEQYADLKEHYGAASLTAQASEPRSGKRYNVAPYDGNHPDTGIRKKVYQGVDSNGEDRRLDGRFVRLRVSATVGEGRNAVTRTITRDYRINKRIPYALLSRSRVMIGQNVNLDGPIGSRFVETDHPEGHPIQMVSDFRGLDSELDAGLDTLQSQLSIYDTGTQDNRINLAHPSEKEADVIDDQNGDGFVDGYDYFLQTYDQNDDDAVSEAEFNIDDDPERAKLFDLMNRWRTPNDDVAEVISLRDQYAKVDGEVHLRVGQEQWEQSIDGGGYQSVFEGRITNRPGETPVQFNSQETENYQFEPEDLSFTDFRDQTTPLSEQAAPRSTPLAGHPQPEAVPYGADNPYDHYDRPIYYGETFEDVLIPRGTNALFVNCRFIGVTYVDTLASNTMANFNLAGTKELVQGQLFERYPGKTVTIGGETHPSSKPFANNLRFHSCTFEGAVVTETPVVFAHQRNKLAFTGVTQFKIASSTDLTEEEKRRYRRSRLLAPQFSVEMGQVMPPEPADDGSDDTSGDEEDSESIELTGTIIAGIIDMRGDVYVKGTIVTTYEPTSDGAGPVQDGNSPWFNTTLGYFSDEAGDKEAGDPGGARGKVHLQYDPTIPLPDGINGPVEVLPLPSTYREGG
jgi:hypothetical protein